MVVNAVEISGVITKHIPKLSKKGTPKMLMSLKHSEYAYWTVLGFREDVDKMQAIPLNKDVVIFGKLQVSKYLGNWQTQILYKGHKIKQNKELEEMQKVKETPYVPPNVETPKQKIIETSPSEDENDEELPW